MILKRSTWRKHLEIYNQIHNGFLIVHIIMIIFLRVLYCFLSHWLFWKCVGAPPRRGILLYSKLSYYISSVCLISFFLYVYFLLCVLFSSVVSCYIDFLLFHSEPSSLFSLPLTAARSKYVVRYYNGNGNKESTFARDISYICYPSNIFVAVSCVYCRTPGIPPQNKIEMDTLNARLSDRKFNIFFPYCFKRLIRRK